MCGCITMVVVRRQGESERLQRELGELRAQLTALEAAVKEKPDYAMGEGDPSIARWELDRAMLQELKLRAQGLERQLSRISDGTYGICERCGKPIDPRRLAVLPDTNICIDCARGADG